MTWIWEASRTGSFAADQSRNLFEVDVVKLGAENRTTLYLACGLMLVAVILGVRFIGSMGWGSSSAPAPAPAAAVNSAEETPATQGSDKSPFGGKKPVSSRSLDPTLRFDLLKSSEDTKYEGTGSGCVSGVCGYSDGSPESGPAYSAGRGESGPRHLRRHLRRLI